MAQPWTIHFQMQETKETHIWLPGQDDPFFHGEGKDNTFQYSSCIIPWTQKPGAAQSTISKKNQTWLSASNSSRKDYFGAILFICSVMSDSLRAHESQHTRPPCPSPTPRVHPNSCPLSWWCHPAISSSVIPFSSCLQSFPASKKKKRKKVKSLSCVWLFVTPWTVAYHIPPSMGFSRQEYWSGLPFPSPGDLPDLGIDPMSPAL